MKLTKTKVIGLILIISLGGILLFTRGASIQPSQVSSSPSANPAQAQSFKPLILEILNQARFEDLKSYLEKNVYLRLAGEDCCGLLTQSDALSKLSQALPPGAIWRADPNSASPEKITYASERDEVLIFEFESGLVSKITYADKLESLITNLEPDQKSSADN